MNAMNQCYLDLLTSIRDIEIIADRPPNQVRLLAVSKGQPLEKIISLHGAGQQDFGESYLAEALPKISALSKSEIVWHFIGKLQSKKCATIANHFDWVHSICRIKEAKLLHEHRSQEKPALNICIQINIDNNSHKNGILAQELNDFAQEICQFKRLKLRGLMALPDRQDDLDAQRKPFKVMKHLLGTLNEQSYALDTLSLGMSHDYKAAIMEGSTIVRIGQALFGPRDQK